MILRRITEHVRTQNWFAVGLDFLVVVVGILIAFQITSWNEARQDRRAEQRYLAELAVNLEADIVQAKLGQEASLDRLALSEAILQELLPEHERAGFFVEIDRQLTFEEGAFAQYPYGGLTASFYLVSADSTFQELIQTGNIGVFSNRALVTELTAYYGRLNRQRGDDGLLLTQAEAMMAYLRENGLGMSDRASLEEVIALAEADTAFLGFVKSAAFLGHWQYSRLVRVEADAQALLAAVQAEIKGRP
jgi:hypothetical protein